MCNLKVHYRLIRKVLIAQTYFPRNFSQSRNVRQQIEKILSRTDWFFIWANFQNFFFVFSRILEKLQQLIKPTCISVRLDHFWKQLLRDWYFSKHYPLGVVSEKIYFESRTGQCAFSNKPDKAAYFKMGQNAGFVNEARPPFYHGEKSQILSLLERWKMIKMNAFGPNYWYLICKLLIY